MIEPMAGGGLRIDCLSLRTILTYAFDVQDYQISGGPAWAGSDGWSIVAKASGSESPDAGPVHYEDMTDAQRKMFSDLIRQRLQALLADRFQLVLRHDIREQITYALTVSKGGAKMTESADQSRADVLRRGRGQITSNGARMEALARFLAIDLRRPVIDRTGLTAHYDFKLEWTPDTDQQDPDSPAPSLFTAIQEQLGLRLESEKGPVEVLVIERAEKPTGN